LRASDADAALNIDGDLIALQPAEYDCDVLRFRRLPAKNTEAVGANRCAVSWIAARGFTLVDAPLFDDWVRPLKSRAQSGYLQVLDRLATQARSRQAWPDAIGHVQRIVHLDPI
jgi:DNA-binding SARP family transcriptional activator